MKEWKKVKLGSLLTESKIVSENPDTDKRLRVRLNMLGVEKRPRTNDKEGATKYYIRKTGQFIYGKQNLHKGAFGIIPEELDGFESSSDIPAFDVDKSCYPEWIYYFFKKGNLYSELESLAKGVGSKRIQPNQIFKLYIYLPSKDEQRKILENISNVEINYKAILTEAEYQESKLIDLNKSIINDATMGRLSQSWRNEYPSEKIKDDFSLNLNKKLCGSFKEPRLRGIPNGWMLCCLADLIHDMESGKSPQCESRPARDGEWGVLKTTSIQNLYFLKDENKALPNHDKINKKIEVKIGDVLITRAGPQNRVGIVTYVDETQDKLLLSDKIVRIKYLPNLIDGEFLAIALSGGISADYLDSKKTGMSLSQVNISQANMKLTPIFLPPLNEQRVIVDKVKETLKICADLKREISVMRQAAEEILQSTLVQLLGEENTNIRIEKNTPKKTRSYSRKKIYDNNTTLMELVDLLKIHGKLHVEDLWKMSKHFDNKNISDSIDGFYADLKKKVEIDKAIKEVVGEKGYLEMV